MTENNSVPVLPNISHFVPSHGLTEKIICNSSHPYKIFRFFNEIRFPHCSDTHTAVNEVDYSQVFDDTGFMLKPCWGGRSSLQIYA